MAEVAPIVAATTALPAVKAPAKKAKKATGGPKSRKLSGPSVTELLTQAVAASKERGGVSLAALKKSLAASGYDVEKNNSRIKLGLKSLVTKGTLLQTKGTGASGSFKLNKKQAEKDKAAKKKQPAAAASKAKKPAGKKAKKAGTAAAKKSVKKVAKKPVSAAKKAAKSPKKSKVTKPKKTTKSPAKPLKPKPKAKPKASKAKLAPKKK
ncbi:histone H1-like [Rhineura floridana]|uniref:histone H1-like n=1 Tax=Rhineura floridana TaxID=261503 RepID=UPI002AC836F3|nr:histone H1-like [Rhineura floridana]XP_061445760.1 histone H1-like [Rhineura floridana]